MRNGVLPKSAEGYLKAIATLKHFAANNSEFNRRTGSSDMDQRTLREFCTAQFRDIVKQAGPGAIMSSYNEVNGTPAAASVQLMDTLARQTFGFDGYFTSDCDAVYEIQAGHQWQPKNASAPLDQDGRTAYANSAGEDLDCDQGYHDDYNYGNTIPTALRHYSVDRGRYGFQLARSANDVVAQRIVRVRGRLNPRPSVVTAKPSLMSDASRGIVQRIFFPPHATVDPKLTVSMSDESLFGYVTKGKSTKLPKGSRVTYRSDRPAVVSIRRNTITTNRPGVATVTAVVRWRGGHATGEFVVDVTR